jgi:hypothetical protein
VLCRPKTALYEEDRDGYQENEKGNSTPDPMDFSVSLTDPSWVKLPNVRAACA